MSRDWTPRECYIADRHFREKDGTGFLDMGFVWEDADGTRTPMYTVEETEFRKRYPIIGTTFDELWRWFCAKDDKDRAERVIGMIEAKLTAYAVKSSKANRTTVEKWFDGALDESFYYNTENNRLFVPFLDELYANANTDYLYCVVGRSGSGKTTITNILRDNFGMNTVESFTTRPPRYPNEPGHIYVSKEEFDMIPMVAYTKFNGYEYGVPENIVDKAQLYVIDIPGVKTLQERYVGKPMKVVYLDCPKEVLRDRMRRRGDTEEMIEKRMANDDVMFAEENTFPFDYRIDATKSDEEVAGLLMWYMTETEHESRGA